MTKPCWVVKERSKNEFAHRIRCHKARQRDKDFWICVMRIHRSRMKRTENRHRTSTHTGGVAVSPKTWIRYRKPLSESSCPLKGRFPVLDFLLDENATVCDLRAAFQNGTSIEKEVNHFSPSTVRRPSPLGDGSLFVSVKPPHLFALISHRMAIPRVATH